MTIVASQLTTDRNGPSCMIRTWLIAGSRDARSPACWTERRRRSRGSSAATREAQADTPEVSSSDYTPWRAASSDHCRRGNSRGNTCLTALCIQGVPGAREFLSVQVEHSMRRIYELLIRRFRVRAPDAPPRLTCINLVQVAPRPGVSWKQRSASWAHRTFRMHRMSSRSVMPRCAMSRLSAASLAGMRLHDEPGARGSLTGLERRPSGGWARSG
jgi:hypothetical protein